MRHKIAAVICAMGLAVGQASAATITVACGALGIGYELCKESAEDWGKRTGNIVLAFPTPRLPPERREFYRQILSDGSGKVDVFRVNLYNTMILRDYFLDLSPYIDPEEDGHFDGLLALSTFDGELKALPQDLTFGLLYYRADLLEKYGQKVPTTWAELEDAARTIQEGERAEGRRNFYGYTFGADSPLARMSVIFEWVASHGGGQIIEEDGTISIANPEAAEAMYQAQRILNDLVPLNVGRQSQVAARRQFQSGRAAFMHNEPSAWPIVSSWGSQVYGKVGLSSLPNTGDPELPVTTVNLTQIAVNKNSAHPEAAADLARFLTSQAEQLHFALEAGYAPTRPAVYEEDVVKELQPYLVTLNELFTVPIILPVRETGDQSLAVTAVLDDALLRILTEEVDVETGLAEVAEELEALKANGWQQ